MAENGVRTTNFPLLNTLDDVLGNADGTTGRMSVARLVSLIAGRLGPAYETLAELAADLDWAAGSLATVWGDGDEALIGVYAKSGASGAGDWTRIGDLPTSALTTSQLAAKADQVDLDDLETLVASLAAGLTPAGEWDPSGGVFPTGASANDFYVANAAGTVDGETFAIGDWLIALIATPSSTTFAGNWTRADYSAVVASVFNPDLFLAKAGNLAGLADVDAAKVNLELGNAANFGMVYDPDFENVSPLHPTGRAAIAGEIDTKIAASVISGTWVPVLSEVFFPTTLGTPFAMTIGNANWTKIGDRVFVECSLSSIAKDAGADAMNPVMISGLPFPPASNATGVGSMQVFNITTLDTPFCNINRAYGAVTGLLALQGSSVSGQTELLLVSNFPVSSAALALSFSYKTA